MTSRPARQPLVGEYRRLALIPVRAARSAAADPVTNRRNLVRRLKGRKVLQPQARALYPRVTELPRLDNLVRLADVSRDSAGGVLDGDPRDIRVHQEPDK